MEYAIPREEFKERIKKLQRLMADNDLEALIAFGNEASRK